MLAPSKLAALLLGLALVASACTGGGDVETVVEPEPTAVAATAQPTEPPAPVPSEPPSTAAPTAPPVEQPTPVPTATVPAGFMLCFPVTVDGEQRETVAVDTDGDGLDDDCEYADHVQEGEVDEGEPEDGEVDEGEPATVEPTPTPTAEDDFVLVTSIKRRGMFYYDQPLPLSDNGTRVLAGWAGDPTCRWFNRWWDGEAWTEQVQNMWEGVVSEEGTDPILPSDNLRPLLPEHPRRHCGFMIDHHPLTCTAVTPAACVIEADGTATATRLLSYHEVDGFISGHPFRNGLYHRAPDADTPNVPESVALAYISNCLNEWSTYVLSRIPFYEMNVPAEVGCNMLWAMMTSPINTMGVVDIACVWEQFKNLFLRGGDRLSALVETGWAEHCGSWLDPNPDLPLNERCENLFLRVNPNGNLAELRATSLCFFDPSYRVSISERERVTRQQLVELTGRCAELSFLANVVVAFATIDLPTDVAFVNPSTVTHC